MAPEHLSNVQTIVIGFHDRPEIANMDLLVPNHRLSGVEKWTSFTLQHLFIIMLPPDIRPSGLFAVFRCKAHKLFLTYI
jgi:hypothetical protein